MLFDIQRAAPIRFRDNLIQLMSKTPDPASYVRGRVSHAAVTKQQKSQSDKVRDLIVAEVSSTISKMVSVQSDASYNSFLDQRSRKVIV